MTKSETRRLVEIFLAEMIILLGLWYWNPFVAKFLSVLAVTICAGVLIVALISELLERSKVPKFYFFAMGISIFAPIAVAMIMVYIGGENWSL